MELKLLHLSDIHFQHFGTCDHLDSDDDIRNELKFDLEKVVAKNGSINAILISGDIAFSAKEDEYLKASEWLNTICNLCNCLEENVLPVPGNHDIEWEEIGVMLNTTHEHFKTLRNRTIIDSELRKFLIKDRDLNSLLSPFRNFYNFAQKYNAIPLPNSLYWEKDLLIDKVKLRIRGMNSSIISNKKDDEHYSKLILGSHQTTLKREKGMIYLTLCHHPTQWLYDGDGAEEDLIARSRIQLFGHKHIFNVTRINNSIKLSAGALHPSREENGWEPRYNMLGVSIFEHKGQIYLKVRIWERIWDDTIKKFVAKYNTNGLEYNDYEIELDEQERQLMQNEEVNMENEKNDEMQGEIEQIDLTKPNPVRKIAYMFFDLPFHKRIKIANTLNLIEDIDENLNPIQQSQKFLKKAIDERKLADLWEQVAIFNTELSELINPFKM